jgi:hypothetical protein
MTVHRADWFMPPDGDAHLVAFGFGTLTPDANAGFLRSFYNPVTGAVTVISSNIADNNSVRWFAFR